MNQDIDSEVPLSELIRYREDLLRMAGEDGKDVPSPGEWLSRSGAYRWLDEVAQTLGKDRAQETLAADPRPEAERDGRWKPLVKADR